MDRFVVVNFILQKLFVFLDVVVFFLIDVMLQVYLLFVTTGKRERDILPCLCWEKNKKNFERSANQHGHLILYTRVPILNLLLYEILDKLVTYMWAEG